MYEELIVPFQGPCDICDYPDAQWETTYVYQVENGWIPAYRIIECDGCGSAGTINPLYPPRILRPQDRIIGAIVYALVGIPSVWLVRLWLHSDRRIWPLFGTLR